MATWVIQKNGINLLAGESIQTAVESDGGEVIHASVVPSIGAIICHLNEPKGNNVIPYGSTAMVELARIKKWKGLFINDQFNSTSWNMHRIDMLNRDAKVMKISDIHDFVRDQDFKDKVFIRPHLNRKLFTGFELTFHDLFNISQSLRIGRTKVTQEDEITVASSKEIFSETRWFVVDGKVIDGSAYRVRGRQFMYNIKNDHEIKEAQKLADVWLPHPTCVMDVAETQYGLKVVEFNCFNSSGFYHHDIPKIIKAVNALF